MPSTLVVLLAASIAPAGERTAGWKAADAGHYLDERQQVWFGRARCISCHTGLPYALARPALRQLVGDKKASTPEGRMLTQIKQRVANWDKLDTKEFGLYYDSNDTLKKQSWGTEAIFNAVLLAFDDRYAGRTTPSAATKQALAHLWQTQVKAGEHKGSWEWLDFQEPPWGDKEARYLGASLAAIAVATAPGADGDSDGRVQLLRNYLKERLPRQNLHNQVWGLWAATKMDGILTKEEQKKLIARLLAKQRADGGWSLLAMGPWSRQGGIAREEESDSYATALLLHVLQLAGVPKDHDQMAKGLDWLRNHQTTSGAWSSVSLIKKRDPASHVGKFMSDAATAFAVLALSH